MALLRGYDEEVDELICSIKGCLQPTVQTVKMSAVPWSREGDQIKSSDVRYEFVGLCEEDFVRLFPIRAGMMRFIDGRD